MSRYLGAGWAAAHGPADPRQFAIWVLEHGFRGLLPAPALRSVDWIAVRRTVSDLPFGLAAAWRLAGIDEAEERVDGALASRNRNDAAVAVQAVLAAVRRALSLGIHRVILEPGAVRFASDSGPLDLADSTLGWTRDRAGSQVARREAGLDAALDGACRSLHAVCKAFPDTEFCLTASRSVAGLGTPRGLEAVFEDLAGRRLGYWHEAAITACRQDRLGEPQGEWLERFATRMRGITCTDWADGRLHLPPGSGLVDYPLVANYLPVVTGAFPVVLELDPGVPPGEVPGIHSFLDKFGL